MHARLSSRLRMTAEEREAEWRAIEAKAKESPLYGKLKDRLTVKLKSMQSADEAPAPIAESAEDEEAERVTAEAAAEAERASAEAAEKAAEEAAAALIAEEEAEKAARTNKKAKRRGKQKNTKQKQKGPEAAGPAPPSPPCADAALSEGEEPSPLPPPAPLGERRPSLVGGASLERRPSGERRLRRS